MKKFCLLILLFAFAGCHDDLSTPHISISEAWARASAPGQVVGAAYMSFTAQQAYRLDKVISPVAQSVEIHSMHMDQGVMRMRMLEKLDIPAKRKVTLAPGQTHLMLIDLKSPLQAGQKIELQLSFTAGDGSHQQQTIVVPVLAK